MSRAYWTVWRFSILAQWRHRGVWLSLVAALVIALLSLWVGALALTERHTIMVSFAAPLGRLSCIALTILLSVSVVIRDIQDRSWLLALASPLPRAHWLLGTSLGLATGGVFHAVLCAMPLWLIQPSQTTLLWTVSLGLEAILVSALALAAALALRQIPTAVLTTALFYLAGRVMGLIELLLTRSPFEETIVHGLSVTLIDALTLVLPRLDAFTLTTWLTPSSSMPHPDGWTLLKLSLQTLIYTVIALATAQIDLTRKEVIE